MLVVVAARVRGRGRTASSPGRHTRSPGPHRVTATTTPTTRRTSTTTATSRRAPPALPAGAAGGGFSTTGGALTGAGDGGGLGAGAPGPAGAGRRAGGCGAAGRGAWETSVPVTMTRRREGLGLIGDLGSGRRTGSRSGPTPPGVRGTLGEDTAAGTACPSFSAQQTWPELATPAPSPRSVEFRVEIGPVPRRDRSGSAPRSVRSLIVPTCRPTGAGPARDRRSTPARNHHGTARTAEPC